ncbi:hypothetical protein LIER_18066 [Lithospermum erythrorhizon]|uniref:Uncharacterized protein n=1 Tax=Lithospermum erythrorhizon TaxID=34254 RepID=A0AAV3QGR5_LITER
MAFSANAIIFPKHHSTTSSHLHWTSASSHQESYKPLTTSLKFHFQEFRASNTPLFAIPARTTSIEQPDVITLPTAPPSWREFAEKISGEWDGFGADFTKEGKPIELPESVVPEAYREWEVKVHDWQTQCPTLASQEHVSLTYKLIRLLPTVGCEADAATRYTIDERSVFSNQESSACSCFAYQPSTGCYAAVWPVKGQFDDSMSGNFRRVLELEHCLIHPDDRESRMRVIQVVSLEGNHQHYKVEVQSIKVFVEQWYGPFRNGDQLGGCSIRDSAFAATEPSKPSEIIGPVWQSVAAVAKFEDSENILIGEYADDGDRVPKTVVRDESNAILLPKKMWCSSSKTEDGDTCCEAGWLLSQGRAITSKFFFSNGLQTQPKEIHLACETAVTPDQ